MGLSELKRYAWRGLAAAYERSRAVRARHRGTVAILTYHRVLSGEELADEVVQPGMYVRTDVFRMHMEYLLERFEVMTMAGLLERWRSRSWKHDSAACVITFDDGWLDNYRHALPILRHYGLPATVFLPTDFIGTSRWFWPEQLGYLLRVAESPSYPTDRRKALYAAIKAGIEKGRTRNALRPIQGRMSSEHTDDVIEACKALDAVYLEQLITSLVREFEIKIPERRMVMNWDEVREMSQHEVTFGSHSCSHRLLDRVTPDECRREATASYEALQKSGANVVPVFCYPNGNYNQAIKEVIGEAGYEAAVSCRVGLEREEPSDLLALRRISLHHDLSDTPSLLALAVSGLR